MAGAAPPTGLLLGHAVRGVRLPGPAGNGRLVMAAALRNLTIAITKVAGHLDIAPRRGTRPATPPGSWPPSDSAQYERNGHYATAPKPWGQ